MVVDKLNRKISVGDIIAVGDYSNSIGVAKVTKINHDTIVFRYYATYKEGKKTDINILKNEPDSYIGWSYYYKVPERVLILRKNKLKT